MLPRYPLVSLMSLSCEWVGTNCVRRTNLGGPSSCPKFTTVYSDLLSEVPMRLGRRAEKIALLPPPLSGDDDEGEDPNPYSAAFPLPLDDADGEPVERPEGGLIIEPIELLMVDEAKLFGLEPEWERRVDCVPPPRRGGMAIEEDIVA